MAPDCRKSRNVNFFGVICKIFESLFKNLLATASVKGTNACDLGIQNTGSLLEPGCVVRSVCKAVAGQSGEFLSEGSGMVLISDLD